jgi:glutamate dehydrogenase (NAD(P)+)
MAAMATRRWWPLVPRTSSWFMAANLTTTRHGDAIAMTAVHDRVFDHRLGGVRFVERGSVDEVTHLAAGMAEKCAASQVPVGGQKTLVVCPSGVPPDPERRAEILAAHILEIAATDDDGGVFGPDMACGSEVLDRLATMPVVGERVTGLSEACFGLDINRRAFTARGVVHAFDCLTRLRETRATSATIQGFGMVGAPIALALVQRGLKVRAVSNRHGALIDPNGLDVAWLFAWWNESGDDCLARYAMNIPGARLARDPNELLDVRADVFVPAARTTMLALADEVESCRSENRDVQPVEQFLDRSDCAVVLEAANHPLTTAAEEFLEQRGVRILPDVLVNTGGMVGCYAEWRYRDLVRRGTVSLDDLADRCHAYTARTIEENMTSLVAADSSARCSAASIVMRNRAELLDASSMQDLFGLAG